MTGSRVAYRYESICDVRMAYLCEYVSIFLALMTLFRMLLKVFTNNIWCVMYGVPMTICEYAFDVVDYFLHLTLFTAYNK